MDNNIQVKKYVPGEDIMEKYMAWSLDEKNLEESSSGGIFGEIAKVILKKDGAIIAPIMSPDWRYAEYEVVTKNCVAADFVIEKMKGSKYIKARVPIKDILEVIDGLGARPAVIVALPCMIHGFKRYFSPEQLENIYFVELKCHGTIKGKVYAEHVTKIMEKLQRLQSHIGAYPEVKFRHKNTGWRNSTKLWVRASNGHVYCKRGKLIKDYIKGTNLNDYCKACTMKGLGDMILGDYWNCPVQIENPMGTSEVTVLTRKGLELWDMIKENLYYEKIYGHRIAIMGGSTMSNNGSVMMTQNFIDYMSKLSDNIGFTLLEYETTNPAKPMMERILPEKTTKKINYGFHSTWCLLDPDKLKRYIKSLVFKNQTPLERQILDCDTVVYLGGDHFAGKAILRNKLFWFIRFLFNGMDFRNLKRAGKKVYMVSQTMGGFSWYVKPFAKMFFKHLDGIYLRDQYSMSEMQKLGMTNIKYAPDLAFLNLYRENEDKWIDRQLSLPENYTVLVISNLWKKYAKSKEEFLSKLAKIADTMAEKTKLPVLVMAHSYNLQLNSENDLVYHVVVRAKNPNVKAFTLPLLPYEFRQILGKSRLNVSLRMHASISSLCQITPVIPIAYGIKFQAMYKDLDLLQLVADSLDPELIKQKIDHVMSLPVCNSTRIFKSVTKMLFSRQTPKTPIYEILKEMI